MVQPLWAVLYKSYGIGLHGHKGQGRAQPVNNTA